MFNNFINYSIDVSQFERQAAQKLIQSLNAFDKLKSRQLINEVGWNFSLFFGTEDWGGGLYVMESGYLNKRIKKGKPKKFLPQKFSTK